MPMRATRTVLGLLLLPALAWSAAGGEPAAKPMAEEPAAAAAAPAQSSAEGRWIGPIVVDKGSAEVDIVVDLEQAEDGTWVGHMAVPVQAVESTPVTDVSVEDGRVSWAYTDHSGVAVLTGTVEGDIMAGSDLEQGQTFPFELHRVGPPGHPICPHVELTDLANLGELREVFNRDVGKTRLLMVLAPSCGLCRSGTRLIGRYVLDRFPDADLAAYAVWMPISDKDSRELAQKETCNLLDPRARHFWIGDTSLSDALRPLVGLPADGPTAWDVYLVYGPDARWEGEAPPQPMTWMQRMGTPLPRERILNAVDLANEIAPVVK